MNTNPTAAPLSAEQLGRIDAVLAAAEICMNINAMREFVMSSRALIAQARAALPTQAAILEARAEGRAEAVEILSDLCAETGIDEYTGWSKSGAPEDEGSAYWKLDKLRELFKCDDKLHNLFDRAEEMYWRAKGEKDEAEREMRMVERAPFYKPLHDFLAKHEAWDLMGDLKREAAPVGALPPLPDQHDELTARWQCDACDGRGHDGEAHYQGHFQPPEPFPCSHCGGNGQNAIDAYTADQMQDYARAAILADRAGQAVQQAKAGYVLAPKIPTPAMLDAAHLAEHCGHGDKHFTNAYGAMIAAIATTQKEGE